MHQSNERLVRGMFAVALGLSGCAALAYQVAWQRVLTQVIGSDSISTVLIVSIFMICLGLGSEIARQLLQAKSLRGIVAYAVIEAAVGVYGVISIPLMRFTNEQFASFGIDSVAVDFFVNLVLLALPVIGMGLTTPLIVHVVKRELSNVGRTVGTLYGCNIAGAAIGAFVTGLMLIELFGLIGTTIAAAALNFAAALIALASIKKSSNRSDQADVAELEDITPIPFGPSAAAVLFGFGTLAIQIIFFRVLSNYFTLSTIVFPIVLCAYLFLMSAGQWLGGKLADAYSTKLPVVIAGLFASGALLFLVALRFPPSWAAEFGALRFSSFNGGLLDDTRRHLIGDPPVSTVFIFSALFMLSVVAWSGLFPVMFRLVTSNIKEAGNKFARIYTLYTVGNVAGAFVCGIFLLPLMGTGGAALLTILIVGAGSGVLLLGRAATNSRHALTVTLAGCCLAVLVPLNFYKSFRLGAYEVSDVFEGKTGVATVVPTSKFYTIIDINRTASASAIKNDPGPADAYEAWRWNHTELMAVDPTFRPKRVLIIGIGHAYLVDALLDIPSIENIDVVDISQEVVSAVKAHTHTSTRRIFSDPRVKIIIGDGRRFVQSAVKRGMHYDLVQTKINEPWHAGGGNLFTVEFFETQKRLLAPGGYLGVRPLSGHLTDGLQVFKNAIWPGYYHLYFKNGDLKMPREATVTPDILDPWQKELPGRTSPKASQRKHLDVAFFSSVPPELTTDHNTDDRPTFEYYWFRKTMGTWVSPQSVFWNMDLTKYQNQIPVLYK